jgi:hypothetical protein
MSLAALSDLLPAVPIGQPKTRWFKAPDAEDDPANPGDFDNWPRAARRLWKIILRQLRKNGAKMIVDPVWKLAQLCGRCQRWVWKALAQLQELGVLRRFWVKGREKVENRKGHHGEVGRATEIVIDLAGPEPKAKQKPKAKATTKASSGQVPNTPGVIPKATPEQQAAADRRHAETAALNAEAGDPVPAGSVLKWWEKLKAGVGIVSGDAEASKKAESDARNAAAAAEALARLEAGQGRGERDRSQSPADPAGPEEVPAPESGS